MRGGKGQSVSSAATFGLGSSVSSYMVVASICFPSGTIVSGKLLAENGQHTETVSDPFVQRDPVGVGSGASQHQKKRLADAVLAAVFQLNEGS